MDSKCIVNDGTEEEDVENVEAEVGTLELVKVLVVVVVVVVVFVVVVDDALPAPGTPTDGEEERGNA